MKWILYTMGRVLVVFGESLFTVFSSLGWKLVDRFGTRRQQKLFQDKRMVSLMHELNLFEHEMAKAKARLANQPPAPREGVN